MTSSPSARRMPYQVTPVPDVPAAADQLAALGAANAWLREVIEANGAEIAALRTQVAALSAEVAAVRGRLGQNPRNSSKPPSSEGLTKPAPRSLRRKSGRKPGRPKGQPGATMKMTDHPDEVVTHEPGRCSGCGNGLSGAPVTGTARRQLVDLPAEIRALVTEHRIISRRCSCGVATAGTAPAQVAAPVQYGPRISSVCAYLWHGQFLSRNRTCRAVSELFGVPVSPGAVTAMVRRIAGALGASLDAIRKALTAAPVAHFDETGFRVAGNLAWVHSASAGKYALITVHRRRGREATDAAGVLPAFRGIAVHDACAPYETYQNLGQAGPVQRARTTRTAGRRRHGPARPVVLAAQAAEAGRDMKRLADASLAIDGTLHHVDPASLTEARHRYHSALLMGQRQTAARRQPAHAQAPRPGPTAPATPGRIPALHPRPPRAVR